MFDFEIFQYFDKMNLWIKQEHLFNLAYGKLASKSFSQERCAQNWSMRLPVEESKLFQLTVQIRSRFLIFVVKF